MASRKSQNVLILNSRQSLRPVGDDPWIINTGRAVQYAAATAGTVLTSIGMNSWEMTVSFASRFKVRQKIFVPAKAGTNPSDIKSDLIREFELDCNLVDWQCIDIVRGSRGNDQFRHVRDRMMINEAGVIYPVSIRRGGNLEKLLIEAESKRKSIDGQFRVEYDKAPRTSKMMIDKGRIDLTLDLKLSNFIIHWTRTAHSRWPGETSYQYYDAIARSGQFYPRSAFDTLLHILAEKRLRASSRHYRSGISAVPFSALGPSKAAALMRWRSRYREMTFEPYGLAIHSDIAEQIGIEKVYYGNPEMYQYLEDSRKPYFQSIGTSGFWMPEQEYRHLGDIDLADIPPEALKIVVRDSQTIELVRKLYKEEIFSFYK